MSRPTDAARGARGGRPVPSRWGDAPEPVSIAAVLSQLSRHRCCDNTASDTPPRVPRGVMTRPVPRGVMTRRSAAARRRRLRRVHVCGSSHCPRLSVSLASRCPVCRSGLCTSLQVQPRVRSAEESGRVRA
eukprot:3330536-Prymnesium_polylepis.2